MLITMIMPGIPTHITGGSKIVFEYANRVAERHPEVMIEILYLSDIDNSRLGSLRMPMWVKRTINFVRGKFHPRWFTFHGNVRHRTIFSIDDSTVSDGDWVFATAASTAQGVQALSASKGRKGYLIQDYETWEMPPSELENTYRYGMTNIVIARWLKDKVDSVTSGNCIYIHNPVDTEKYHPDKRFVRDSNSVAILYHPGLHKGFIYAWKAILSARKCIPGLHVNMFGTYAPPADLPEWVTYTRKADEKDLLRIYNSSSIFVCASVKEGYGLTCVEAMACGCALVVTDFEGSREYTRNGENAIVVPVGDVDAISNAMVRVLSNDNLRVSLAKAGVETARSFDWAPAVKQFERVLGL